MTGTDAPGEWIHSLADVADNPRCGGKARGLAKLIAAGLPVPPGIVLDSRAFTSIVGPLPIDPTQSAPRTHELAHALARLHQIEVPPALIEEISRRVPGAASLAVRSSANFEDTEAGTAAGLLESVTDVGPEHLASAIAEVWNSSLVGSVVAYARRRASEIAVAVIVQPFVRGERVIVYTRPPGNAETDEMIIQRGETLARVSRSSTDAAGRIARAAEVAIGATNGADVELVDGHGTLWVVQARPIVHPVQTIRPPLPPALLASLIADGRRWVWDVAHNPDPLSTAQTELVERVERSQVAPYSLRVSGGYLYSAPRTAAPAALTDDLEARVREIESRLEALLVDTHGLDEALGRYIAFYKIWSNELSPLVSAARKAATKAVTTAHVVRPSSVEATLMSAARGEITADAVVTRLGVLAQAWDVAVPTYAERPSVLYDAIARAATVRAPVVASSADASAIAADLAERDDLWFARAQWLVRRALLARGRELDLDDEDVCWIPFDDLIAGIDRGSAKRRAAGVRAAADRAMSWEAPLVVNGEPTDPRDQGALRGAGTGGRATGRVVKYASLTSAVMAKPGDVIVARAITPALAVMLIGCAAIVSETGGLLDHGAAMARELGIPCVVGCRDAWRVLEDGAIVEVDGAAGVVTVRG